jgi:hypothetical protein
VTNQSLQHANVKSGAQLRAVRQSDKDVVSFDVWGSIFERNGGRGDRIHRRIAARSVARLPK